MKKMSQLLSGHLKCVTDVLTMIFPAINSLEPYGYDKSDSFVREWDDFNDSQSQKAIENLGF